MKYDKNSKLQKTRSPDVAEKAERYNEK